MKKYPKIILERFADGHIGYQVEGFGDTEFNVWTAYTDKTVMLYATSIAQKIRAQYTPGNLGPLLQYEVDNNLVGV